MNIEFEISNEEIIRSNKIGNKDLAEDHSFPAVLYYEGVVTISDDENNVIKEPYSLPDFTSRLFIELDKLETSESATVSIEFVEDYMPILLQKQGKKIFLQLKYKPAKLSFNFWEFRENFINETKKLFYRLLSFQGSDVLRKTTDEYLNTLILKLNI